MASSTFSHFEADYLSSTRAAAQNIERMADLIPGAERDKLASATVKAIEAAQDIVTQMELEARSTGGSTKAELVAQARDYKAGIGLLKNKLKAAKSAVTTASEERARAQLFESADPATRQEAENQRAQLLQNTERMHKGTEKIRQATRVALETEQVASRRAWRRRPPGLSRGGLALTTPLLSRLSTASLAPASYAAPVTHLHLNPCRPRARRSTTPSLPPPPRPQLYPTRSLTRPASAPRRAALSTTSRRSETSSNARAPRYASPTRAWIDRRKS